jgi:hypothetical protein
LSLVIFKFDIEEKYMFTFGEIFWFFVLITPVLGVIATAQQHFKNNIMSDAPPWLVGMVVPGLYLIAIAIGSLLISMFIEYPKGTVQEEGLLILKIFVLTTVVCGILDIVLRLYTWFRARKS